MVWYCSRGVTTRTLLPAPEALSTTTEADELVEKTADTAELCDKDHH